MVPEEESNSYIIPLISLTDLYSRPMNYLHSYLQPASSTSSRFSLDCLALHPQSAELDCYGGGGWGRSIWGDTERVRAARKSYDKKPDSNVASLTPVSSRRIGGPPKTFPHENVPTVRCSGRPWAAALFGFVISSTTNAAPLLQYTPRLAWRG